MTSIPATILAVLDEHHLVLVRESDTTWALDDERRDAVIEEMARAIEQQQRKEAA